MKKLYFFRSEKISTHFRVAGEKGNHVYKIYKLPKRIYLLSVSLLKKAKEKKSNIRVWLNENTRHSETRKLLQECMVD